MNKSDAPSPHPAVIAILLATLIGANAVLVSWPKENRQGESHSMSGPITLAARTESEPSPRLIQGRTLDEWREIMLTLDHNDATRADSVPALMEIARTSDFPWFTRRQAAVTLGRWGTAATAAIPLLEELLDTPEEDAGEAPVFWALKGLSLFGPAARDVVPKVSTIALNPHRPVEQRLAAMECLSQIGSANPSGLLPLLQISQINVIESAPLILRRGSIEAIGYFRGGAPTAVPVLMRALDDPDVEMRREAAIALGRQGLTAEIAQTALFDRFVSDDDPTVRDAAGIALGQTGLIILPAVISLLEEKDPELRLRSAVILGKMGRGAASAAPALKALWEDPDAEIRLAGLKAYWKVTQRGDSVAPNAAAELTDSNRNIRREAYLLLVALGSSARTAQPVLEAQLESNRPEVRSVARKLLRMPQTSP